MAKPSNGIKTDVNLNEEFMVSCLGGGGKLNIGEAGLSCSMPNGEIVKPASPPPAGPKK
jgi:hypothetical protein